MAARYPSLPRIWLIGDARNDAALEHLLSRLPRGSGFVFRHYHLAPEARRARFDRLARIARRHGHAVVLSGTACEARRWRADDAYGTGRQFATAHSLREIGAARRARASAILLSPVFPTRSHPDAPTLGPLRFRLLAAQAKLPVIALGGMNARRARRLRWAAWAAIDGLILADS